MTVEEAAFLVAVQRIVRRVDVQHDLRRGRLVRLDEQLQQQRVHRRGVRHDLLVAIRRGGFQHRQLQTVQRALAGQRPPAIRRPTAPRAGHVRTLAQQRHQTVAAQLVVIVEILVTQADAHDALLHQRLDIVLHAARRAMIGETASQPLQNAGAILQLPQRQRAAVRRQLLAVERTHHPASPKTSKLQLFRVTLRSHEVVLLVP